MLISKYKKWNIVFLVLIHSTLVLGQNKKTLSERLQINDSLYAIAISNNDDSLTNIALQQYVKLYYKEHNWESFNKYRFKHLKLTHKTKDTFARARTLEYVGKYFGKVDQTDSTYYYYTKSFIDYNSINDSLNAGFMLVNLAIIQKNVRDYSGSKYKCRLAIKYLTNRAKSRRIASVHNTLATNFSEIDEYKKAIEHHEIALELRKRTPKDSIYIIHSLNNIGDVHITYKKYDKAIKYLSQAYSLESLINKYPREKATILDNLTYARFKNGEKENILNSFNKALSIGQEIGYTRVIINSHIHLAEYFEKNNDKEKAIYNAKKATIIAKKVKYYQDYLRASKILGNLSEVEMSKRIFNERDAIRDSLEIAEQKKRDSYNEIELLVDEKNILLEQKDKQVSTTTKTIKVLISLSVILVILFIYFFIKKRKQKKQLSQKLELADKELNDKTFQKKELESQLEDTNKVLDDKNLQLQGLKDYGFEKNDEAYQKAFFETLKTKYGINKSNFKFWNVFIKDLSQEEQIEILGIKIDALDKRRIALREKIKKKRPINSDFTSKIAKRIYLDEEELFKNTYQKKE